MDYLIVKWVHILSSTFLFGTGIGSAFYMLSTSISRDVRAIAVISRHVVLADWIFTSTTVILQPLLDRARDPRVFRAGGGVLADGRQAGLMVMQWEHLHLCDASLPTGFPPRRFFYAMSKELALPSLIFPLSTPFNRSCSITLVRSVSQKRQQTHHGPTLQKTKEDLRDVSHGRGDRPRYQLAFVGRERPGGALGGGMGRDQRHPLTGHPAAAQRAGRLGPGAPPFLGSHAAGRSASAYAPTNVA